MKIHWFTLLGLCFILLSIQCTAPSFEENENKEEEIPPEGNNNLIPDDQTDYDCLVWQGDLHKFRTEKDGSLRLYDEDEMKSSACIAAPLKTLAGTGWLFEVKYSFNPSANNHALIWLMADSPNLSHSVNGYFIQVGGKEDRVYLYQRKNDITTLICQSGLLMKGDSSPHLQFDVRRDKNGYFIYQLSRYKETINQEFIFKDSINSSNLFYCGIECIYTASNCKKMRFPQFHIHHRVTDMEILEPKDFISSLSGQ